ncbi:hypothetical protein MBLNU230_g3623t1 [Neophaeotheca triangularis]
MSDSSVSNCVLSIVTSFTNGLDVLKRLRERKWHRKQSKNVPKKSGNEELLLSRSLRRGPEDISREYQRSIHAAGHHYAVGDATAQTSLAHILLKLNSGLVSIITTFVNRDKPDIQLDYRSLTDLSEQSRSETLDVLRQLYQRLQMKRPEVLPRQPMPDGRSNQRKAVENRPHPDVRQASTHTASKKPKKARKPGIARVIIQNSSQPSQLAIVKPGERGKSSRSPSGTATPPNSTPPTSNISNASNHRTARYQAARPKTAPTPAPTPNAHKRVHSSEVELPLRSQPEKLRSSRSTPRLQKPHTPEEAPPLPRRTHEDTLAPLRRPVDSRLPKRTPTMYSMASASTKMGEIPMHKWHDPWDYDAMAARNREAEEQGWPFQAQEAAVAEDRVKKKRGGLFRMFRRKGSDD